MNEKSTRINELCTNILCYNRLYRIGTPKISDSEFDIMVRELEELDPNNPVLVDKDYTPIGGATQINLPVNIASLTKLSRDKNGSAYDHYLKWVTKYNLHNEMAVLSGKYDGVMILVDESIGGYKPAFKKGEGNRGYSIDHHYKKISTDGIPYEFYSVGEVLFSRKTFESKFADKYENGRNMIAGKTNPLSDSDDSLYYADHMRYSLINKTLGEYAFDKSTQLEMLNTHLNNVPVLFETMLFSDITEEILDELFKKWSQDYEIDGIVIDVDNSDIRKSLGRETGSNNPAYARAYKGDFEDRAETICTNLTWEITKLGVLAPRCWFQPVRLNGANVQKCYVDNAKFVMDSGLHIGAKIEVKRSGMIIPRLSKVFEKLEILQQPDDMSNFDYAQSKGIIPSNCPICGGEVELTENEKGEKVNLMCINPECEGKALRRIVFFFKIMGAKGIGDSTLESFYDMGYDTISKILSITIPELRSFEGYAESKADSTYMALHECLIDTNITKLMHASGYFPRMGADKLGIIREYIEKQEHKNEYGSAITELMMLPGIAEKSANTYFNNVSLFWSFFDTISEYVSIKRTKNDIITIGKCVGWVVLFTRWRDKSIEEIIIKEGGTIKSGYSSAITHVFPAEKGYGSNKEKEAEKAGKIILDQHELKRYLGLNNYKKKDGLESDEFSINF